jgi:hypothetical protein
MGFPVGLRIEAVRVLFDAERHAAGWTGNAVAMELSDGTVIDAAAKCAYTHSATWCGVSATAEPSTLASAALIFNTAQPLY